MQKYPYFEHGMAINNAEEEQLLAEIKASIIQLNTRSTRAAIIRLIELEFNQKKAARADC